MRILLVLAVLAMAAPAMATQGVSGSVVPVGVTINQDTTITVKWNYNGPQEPPEGVGLAGFQLYDGEGKSVCGIPNPDAREMTCPYTLTSYGLKKFGLKAFDEAGGESVMSPFAEVQFGPKLVSPAITDVRAVESRN